MLSKGLYQDSVNLFVVKYLLCEIVTGGSSKLHRRKNGCLSRIGVSL